MKYYIAKIIESIGEHQVEHTVRFTTPDDDAERRIDTIAGTFKPGPIGDPEDGGYLYNGGESFVRKGSYKLISEATYAELDGYIVAWEW
jgi:hypothetical protein